MKTPSRIKDEDAALSGFILFYLMMLLLQLPRTPHPGVILISAWNLEGTGEV